MEGFMRYNNSLHWVFREWKLPWNYFVDIPIPLALHGIIVFTLYYYYCTITTVHYCTTTTVLLLLKTTVVQYLYSCRVFSRCLGPSTVIVLLYTLGCIVFGFTVGLVVMVLDRWHTVLQCTLVTCTLLYCAALSTIKAYNGGLPWWRRFQALRYQRCYHTELLPSLAAEWFEPSPPNIGVDGLNPLGLKCDNR